MEQQTNCMELIGGFRQL